MSYFFYVLKPLMENLHNKTQAVHDKKKDYFERFAKLNIFSFTKPNDDKIYIGAKPTEVYSLFRGNTSSPKKSKTDDALRLHSERREVSGGSPTFIAPDDIVIDQSSLQYYLCLALQDFYINYFMPLNDDCLQLTIELNKLKEELEHYKEVVSVLKGVVLSSKKKNDDRFEIMTQNLEILQDKCNNIKKSSI